MARTVTGTVVRHSCVRVKDRMRVSVCSSHLRVCSPNKVVSNELVRRLGPLAIPSGEEGPLLTSFFDQLKLVREHNDKVGGVVSTCERRGRLDNCRTPRFTSGTSRFRIAL